MHLSEIVGVFSGPVRWVPRMQRRPFYLLSLRSRCIFFFSVGWINVNVCQGCQAGDDSSHAIGSARSQHGVLWAKRIENGSYSLTWITYARVTDRTQRTARVIALLSFLPVPEEHVIVPVHVCLFAYLSVWLHIVITTTVDWFSRNLGHGPKCETVTFWSRHSNTSSWRNHLWTKPNLRGK